MVKQAKRTRIGLVVETGEAREVHHHCLLIGYGADAINPYLAFESLWQARRDALLDPSLDDDKIVAAYRKGVAKGMLKVMAKMGLRLPASRPRANGDQGMEAMSSVSQSGIISRSSSRYTRL